jgi:sugar phosphate isomerase/epimerase
MRLGFYANYTQETAAFAHEVGFNSMELSAWPQSSLNADRVTDRQLAAMRADLASKDIEISALSLELDPSHMIWLGIDVDIEHEDDVFAFAEVGRVASEAEIVAAYSREKKGLRVGYNTLAPLLAC